MRNFEYRGHKVFVEYEYDEDCQKTFIDVHCPDERVRFCDVSPYGDTTEEVKKWIDLDYPERIGTGPLSMKDLELIESTYTRIAVMGDGETWDLADNVSFHYLSPEEFSKLS